MTDTPSHLVLLNPEQYRAVTTLEGPLLILAGAGSGKTRVLTRRVAHLLHTGADPKSILAVTFTNKAASEMKERIHELVGAGADDVWVSTFHSTCGRILRADIEPLGWTRRFAIYDDDDQRRLIREIISHLGYDPKEVPAKAILSKIDHYKNRMVGPDELLSQQRTHINSPLLRIWREYEDNLRAADAVDFNDLIGLVVRLFKEHPEVKEKWQQRFRYVMVDEYQDTNGAQYGLLRMLAPDANSNLAVVGDDDQSIYGFRGADVTNILNFEKDFPDAAVIRLEQNYRCSGNILDLANAVVQKNTGRFDKKLWTNADQGVQVHIKLYKTASEEGERVARHIQAMKHQEQRDWSDFAIIYRTNATAKTFEKELTKLNIPYKVVGGRSYHAAREVRDILCYLRLIVNPADDAAFLRIVNVPTRGIGAKSLAKLREQAEKRGQPMLQTARSMSSGSDRLAKSLTVFVELIDSLNRDARRKTPVQMVRGVLKKTGYSKMLDEEGAREAKRRLDNLKLLVTDAEAWVPPEDAELPLDSLRAWLDSITLASQADEIPDGGQVTLMTVHCSKGLEFPVVYVVHMMQGVFPHQRSLENGLEEERRLAYVAFTRAQKRLVITRSASVPDWADRNNSAPADDEPLWMKALREKRKKEAVANVAEPSMFLYGLPQAAITGDIPDQAEAPPDDPKALAREEREARTHTHRVWIQQNAPRASGTPDTPEEPQPPPRARFLEPTDPHSLEPITSIEQVQTNAIVVHEAFGYARVKLLLKASKPPRVRVDWGTSDPQFAQLPVWLTLDQLELVRS